MQTSSHYRLYIQKIYGGIKGLSMITGGKSNLSSFQHDQLLFISSDETMIMKQFAC